MNPCEPENDTLPRESTETSITFDGGSEGHSPERDRATGAAPLRVSEFVTARNVDKPGIAATHRSIGEDKTIRERRAVIQNEAPLGAAHFAKRQRPGANLFPAAR